MNRYPDYKDSGVEWISDVPCHWNVVRLKAVIASAQNGIWGDEPQEDENDVVCVRVADFSMETLGVSEDKLTYRNVPERFREGRLLGEGDLVIEKSGGGEKQLVGRVVRYDLPHKAVCSNFLARITPRQEVVDSGFLLYSFQHLYNGRVNYRSVKQTTGIQNLDADSYFNEPTPLPPLDEQRQLAAYLDRKTGQIDTLIQKKQTLIALLSEQRTALIHRAVTKGLDPDVPMKDSGVEWLGEVPEHWTVPKVKHLLSAPLAYGVLKPERYEGDDAVPLIRIKDVDRGAVDEEGLIYISPDQSQEFRRTRVSEGDLIVSVVGTLGKSFIVPESLEGANLSRALARVQVTEDVDVHWFRYYFQSETFERYVDLIAAGTAQRVLNLGGLGNFVVPCPPFEEQREIATYLKREVGMINDLIDRERRAITLMSELRTSLISEVVTGKIDVRGEVTTEHEEVAETTEVNAFLWWTLANYVLNRMAHADHFGRITLVKVLFVLIYELRLQLTGKKYAGPHQRWNFGPHHPTMTHALEATLEKQGYWRKVQVSDERQVRYVALPKASDPDSYFEKYWGSRKAEVDRVIDLFLDVTSHGNAAERAEIIATLYGAWNDLLIAGRTPTDDEIVLEARENWHEHKLSISPERWHNGLKWMRLHDLVPVGFGDMVTPLEVAT